MGNPLVSVIIPARNEKLLASTVQSVLNTTIDVEVIIVLDGPTQYEVPKGCQVIEHPEPQGIRKSINRAVERASGDYLLKVDAHCIFADHFVNELLCACEEDNWIVVARRYTLNPETMKPMPRAVDYYYLSCPWTHPKAFMMQSCPWIGRTEAWADKPIDDLMCFQGSMWFMPFNHFDWFGQLSENLTYAEHHELSMETWLSGGRVMIDKKTWYAHPRTRVSGYHMDMDTVYRDHDFSARYWVGNHYPGAIHEFDWLIDKFWPLPTEYTRHRTEKYYWPEDWRKYYDNAL